MEDFVTYEIAKKLKEKGYPMEEIPTGGIDNRNFPILYDLPKEHPNWQDCKAWWVPTISQVLKWLRDIKTISIEPCATPHNCWYYMIKCKGEIKATYMNNKYKTYEQAALAGIEYVIDNLI